MRIAKPLVTVRNGCENARRFFDRIEVTSSSSSQTLIRRFRRAGSFLETWRDEGISISPNTSPRLREKFLQTVPQQPKPKPLPLKRPHASLLEDIVDPKRYCPESVHNFVTRWIESVVGFEAYRERQCRSDTLLCYSDGDIIRRLTKSAPEMDYRRDADGFALPPTPASKSCLYSANTEDDLKVGRSVPPSDITSVTRPSQKSLVKDPYYRDYNLAEHNIFLFSFGEEFPSDIAGLIDHVRRDRDSIGLPSAWDLKQDTIGLYNLENGTTESAVERYFTANILPALEPTDIVQHTINYPMAKHTVPGFGFGSNLTVSTPVPDMLFGYDRKRAFPQQQQQTRLRSMGNEMVANTQGLVYPFFVIEFKADGPGGSGSMWAATNQCLGGSASCVNVAERLNCQLRQYDEIQPMNSAAFSIAMNGTEARLFVSWKHNENYYMQKVDSFLLQKPNNYIEFCKYVRNILDWGKEQRLNEIRDSLDRLLLEESGQMASQRAKSRRPPLLDSARSNSQKRRKQ